MSGTSVHDESGNVLVPCLLFLSLISLVSLGVLDMTRAETRTAETWNNDYSARLAALSAREMALLKLKTNVSYLGETMTFPDDGGSADVAVTTPYYMGRSVSCIGSYGSARYEFMVEAKLSPRHLKYALAVCDDLELKNGSKVLGDLFVDDVLQADATATVDGTVDLAGNRIMLYDAGLKVVSIDGFTSPDVNGDVSDSEETLSPLGWDLAALKTLAEGAGQVYSKNNETLSDQSLYGVVYFTSNVSSIQIENVRIHGVLVVEPVAESPQVYADSWDTNHQMMISWGNSLKVIPDPTIEEDLAIIAPDTLLTVEGGGTLEALGCVLFGYADFVSGSKGVITGTTMVNGGVKCEGDFLFQAPNAVRDTAPKAIVFTQFEIEEIEYTEP